MQVSVANGDGLERRVTVMLPAELVHAKVAQRLEKLARTAKVDGFRPGKVPMRILRARQGEEVAREVFFGLVRSSFDEVVSKENLHPTGAPTVEIDPAKPYTYTAIFEIFPDINLQPLGEYRVARPVAEVTTADVDMMLQQLRTQRKSWHEVQRPAQLGDLLDVRSQGRVEGVPFEELRPLTLELGENVIADGFDAGLVGAVAGETRHLEVRLPDQYPLPQVSGKTAVFEIQVERVVAPLLPALDAAFVRSFGVPSGELADLRIEMQRNMERTLAQIIESKIKESVLDVLLEVHQFPLPKGMIAQELASIAERVGPRLPQSEAELVEQTHQELFETMAKRRVALGLLLTHIAETQSIVLDKTRFQRTLHDIAASYEDPNVIMRRYLQDNEKRAVLENLVFENQIVDWVASQIVLEDTPSSFSALTRSHSKAPPLPIAEPITPDGNFSHAAP